MSEAARSDLVRSNTKLRIVASVEATTLLVMLVAMVGRWAFDGPDIGAVIGPIHGLVFLTYVVMVIFARTDNGWTLGRTVGLIFAAIVPFGGYVAGHDLRSRAA